MDATGPFEQILTARGQFELLINRVRTSRMTIRGVIGRWSIKDTLVYIMTCEHYLADRLTENQKTKSLSKDIAFENENLRILVYLRPEYGSYLYGKEPEMERIIQKYKSIPLEEVVAQENQAFLSLVNVIESIKPALWETNDWCKGLIKSVLALYEIHIGMIRSWLEAIR